MHGRKSSFLGAVVMPIVHFYGPKEVGYILGKTPPKAFVTFDRFGLLSGTATLQAAEAAGTGTTSDGKPYNVDSVSLTGTVTGIYNTKDVATAASVTFGGVSLMGTGNGNYTLTATVKDDAGKSVTIPTKVQGVVSSIDLTLSPPLLSINGQTYTVSQIKSIVG